MSQSMHRAFFALGNGNLQSGMNVLHQIGSRLEHARTKHPVFAEGEFHALGVINSEMDELTFAVEKETEDRVTDELLDVIVTSIRMLNGEHNTKSDMKYPVCTGNNGFTRVLPSLHG